MAKKFIFDGVVVPGSVIFKIHYVEINETLKVRWNQKTITKAWYEISYSTWEEITSHKAFKAGEKINDTDLAPEDVICDKVERHPNIGDWCKAAYHKGRICRSTTKITIRKPRAK